MVGKSSNQVRGVLDEQSTAHTTGVLVNNGLDAEPATKETCSSKETSRTLDFNPSGARRQRCFRHQRKRVSFASDERTPRLSRSGKRVADVRKNSVADGCGLTARIR